MIATVAAQISVSLIIGKDNYMLGGAGGKAVSGVVQPKPRSRSRKQKNLVSMEQDGFFF